ncbi:MULTISPECIES: putative FMN-dependent luciferase-like monooxygenase [unclassified Rhizobium]|uniref:putative FMN-dependent luciferase-like monooxygenase n=1 Tax=unclassified Rhizobium TaxID=2613769 RepID=UPI000BDCC972|nr:MULTISPECIES: putative FMN-dependent luciferase-like monooxygenase [unclassified Rhizobium]MDH7808802.1 putative FMN-dependent luciferase-like monooxygenase [Rhizobium sp. AN67]MDQ4409167.1 putative FMN-dependent luciferase-like monooxygenase [Rhizobium sp. AN63]SOD50967.1 putative FMN-dependent luciferase-like monooxygenase, KPN_01858 family [Rhizobium sp. AN6A]
MTKTITRKRLGFFTRLLDDVPAGERYRLAVEQIIHAEENGFDSAWIAQHHFHADEGGLPSPAVFLSHVAARTSRIRLGTGVITLPMENALRVAEDTAVLDLLSGGRLQVGFGTGGTRESFEAFGIESDRRGEIYAENLSTIRDAWAGKSLHGGNLLYPNAPQLLDRVWLATFSANGARLAGLSGDGLMLSRTQPRPADNPAATLNEIQNPIIDAYLSGLPKGRTPRILGSRSLFVADDRKRALAFAEIGLRRVADRFAAAGHRIPGNSLEDLIKALDSHVGTPDDVIASLEQDSALARATDITFQVHSIDPPHAEILRSIELIASDVAPALGWSQPTAQRLVAAQ